MKLYERIARLGSKIPLSGYEYQFDPFHEAVIHRLEGTMQPSKKKRLTSDDSDHKKGSSSMSEKQRTLMLDFLSENPSMVLDRSIGGPSNRSNRDESWERLAAILNSCGSGAQKDGCGWRRSWQDLKRYESLKAKESMAKLGNMKTSPPTLMLSPLQEKISSLLNVSISDVALCGNQGAPKSCNESPGPNTPYYHGEEDCSSSTEDALKSAKEHDENKLNEVSMAQALLSIASALNERNAIEERKIRVLENLLAVYATKNGTGIADSVNLGMD